MKLLYARWKPLIHSTIGIALAVSVSACTKKQIPENGEPSHEAAPISGSEPSSEPRGSAASHAQPTEAGAKLTAIETPGSGARLNDPKAEAARKEEIAKPLPPACVSMEFKRAARPGEDLAQQRNLLKLNELANADGIINPASVCVKVNGTPVRFRPVFTQANKKAPKALRGLLLDPISDPAAKVVARFCIGKATCTENCKVPRDEFLDALGGSGDASNSASWDSAGADKDGQVMATVDGALKRELEAGSDYAISDRWRHGTEESACIGKIKGDDRNRIIAQEKQNN